MGWSENRVPQNLIIIVLYIYIYITLFIWLLCIYIYHYVSNDHLMGRHFGARTHTHTHIAIRLKARWSSISAKQLHGSGHEVTINANAVPGTAMVVAAVQKRARFGIPSKQTGQNS